MNRVGEKGLNNFGSKMEIIACKNNNNIDVYFEEYNWIAYNKGYKEFKNGKIKCPYERRTYGVGYLGEGKYKTKVNNKATFFYEEWKGMLRRCYSKEFHKKEPSYIGCEVCEEWHNFQNFADWCQKNYYKVDNDVMRLDKDIYNKNNKEYSEDNCFFVPNRINLLFNKSKNNKKSDLPIGVFEHTYKNNTKYKVSCRTYEEGNVYLGLYDTIDKAFEVYKEFKENYIKQVADEYYFSNLIPKELWKAMYEYEVEITD